jgi:hypothetical protein
MNANLGAFPASPGTGLSGAPPRQPWAATLRPRLRRGCFRPLWGRAPLLSLARWGGGKVGDTVYWINVNVIIGEPKYESRIIISLSYQYTLA